MLEVITILPIVIPPVVLIIGVLQIAPAFVKGSANLLGLEYVILAMPFAYRSIDAGLRAFDLKTLVEASNSLGAGWLTTLWRVVLPNLRTALLSAIVLTIALVLGEFTMASLDLYQTFPVWIVNFEQSSGPVSTAASLLALFVTWLFLMAIVTTPAGGRGGAAAPRSRCLPWGGKKREIPDDHEDHAQVAPGSRRAVRARRDRAPRDDAGLSVTFNQLHRAFGDHPGP